jgi:hypothetical protein
LKKFFDKCKDSAEKSDVYNEGVNFDMYSDDELMKKSVEELNVLLADENLLPYDEPANTEIIRRICKVISKKEKTPNRVLKAKSKKAWKSFEKKYITPKPETTLVEVELVEANKRNKNTFIKAFTALAAAAIVILVVKIPERTTQSLPTEIPITESIETTTAANNTEVSPVEKFNAAIYVKSEGFVWSVPDDFTVIESGTKNYNDNSIKKYTIYSSGDKIFFISALTNTSGDVNSPSKNQLDPFDIFTGTYLEKTKKNENCLRTWIIRDKLIIIYDEEPGSTTFSYDKGVITYAHFP